MSKITSPPPVRLESEADTTRLAVAFAHAMRAGDVVLLAGGLAAGKTYFVRAAVAALGSTDGVSSPTYTLANIYTTPKGTVLHIDTYRIETVADFADLGLEDELAHGVAFIEWGLMLEGEFNDYVSLNLALDPTCEQARTATFSARGPRGTALLAQVLEGFAA